MSKPQKVFSFQDLPEAFPWGVLLVSRETGEMLHANKQMETLYLGEAWEGAPVESRFHFGPKRVFAEMAGELAPGRSWSGRAVPRQNRHGISSVELMAQLDPEDAGRVWIYSLEHPVVDGTVHFSSRSELQILQVLLDNTLEYVFFRDINGQFIITNKAFRNAVATDGVVSAVGRTIDAFISEESAAWVRGIDEQVFSSGMPSVNQVSSFLFNNGTKHWLQMTTVPVRSGGGEIVGSVSVARDISDLKRTESDLRRAIKQARDASRAKGEFLAAMSHEIRTPINGIIGASELCQETRLDVEQRGYVDTVMQCGNTLLSLVNDVLDFSKIEAGQLNLEKLNFSPGALIEEIGDEFAQATRKKGIELIASYPGDLPRYTMGDPTRVKQILYNLVGNAVKFTEKGEVVLRAELIERTETEARIRITVSDTGIGISPARLEAIFTSFTQEDMSTTRKYGGTGLGLAICKELVELMRGTIRVESSLGLGSEFVVELPFELTESAGADAIQFNPELAGMRVLIVDDNPTNRDIYKQMCAGWGYRSATASGGIEALAMMEEAAKHNDPFRLVFLDQQMPGLTGLDLASLVLDRSELSDTHLLLLSSSLNRDEVERADKLGIDRALSKPVKRSTLIEVILETFGINGSGGKRRCAKVSGRKSSPRKAVGRPLKVLLAEDNLVNQKIAQRRLEKLGHPVMVVANGLEALRQAEAAHFDCILMDVQMPEMDGYEATRAIRRMEEAAGRRPQFIVAMTAHALKGDEAKCKAVGMDEYISKPFRVERLRAVLEIAGQRAEATEVEVTLPGYNEMREAFAERITRMSEADREDVVCAAQVLWETLPEDLSNLEQALAAEDYPQVAFIVHTLKGIAGIFIDGGIFEAGTRLEDACEAKDLERVRATADRFTRQLKMLSDVIREVLDGQSLCV